MLATLRRPLSYAAALTAAVLVLLVLVASAPPLVPSAEAITARQGRHIVAIAASKKGAPYRYGAAGPHAFDCSGYTKWVFGRIGRSLPHNSAMQYTRVRHLRASQRRRGDLVFFRSGGRIYHVAIYAGRNDVWHASRPGERVHRERIWTHSVSYGRVR
jgi:cell wall-associated NlpC family hydrolase